MDHRINVIAGLGALCLALGLGMYLLYRNGWMIINAKSAVSFVGSAGGRAATFTRCSGYLKRIVRFPEEGRYAFDLNCDLSRGSVTASLLGPDKAELLCLTPEQPRAEVRLEEKKRYTLLLRFHSATGSYRLQWERI